MINIKIGHVLIIVAILIVLFASIFIGWKFFGKGEIISATGTYKIHSSGRRGLWD